jgi:sialidase-1
MGNNRGKNQLVFCNPADSQYRDRLTLRFSDDEGATWRAPKLIECCSDPAHTKDVAAYSDLVRLSKRSVGILYERDGYREIVFKALRYPE